MAEIGKFIAFEAAIRLLERSGRERLIRDIYEDGKREITAKPLETMLNVVQRVYAPFTDDELSAEISRMVYPEVPWWNGEVRVLFQTITNLRASLDPSCGDWYFTGNYPTPGGTAVANRAFVAYYEKLSGRTYDLVF